MLKKLGIALIVYSMLSALSPVLAQDAPPAAGGRRGGGAAGGRAGGGGESWWLNKPTGGMSAYKTPMRPIWRLADLKRMHAGTNNWSELIVRDNELDATYNSAAPGSTISPRMHPETPTVFVIIAGEMRFTVANQEPTVGRRGSIIHILKQALYAYEVTGGENALWVEINILGYTTLYPGNAARPSALPGAPVARVGFTARPAGYTDGNRLHYNTFDAIATCTTGSAVSAEHMVLSPLIGFVNPADNPCGTGSGNIGSGPSRIGAPAPDTTVPFGHLHSTSVEWWIVQSGIITGTFENFPVLRAVEGDVLYAAPMTWHAMAAEAPSGPSVRLAIGAYQRVSLQNTGPTEP